MNDYELLYLIGERNDDAHQLLIEKYQPLIKSKLYQFKIRSQDYEDYLQEGNLVLALAIKKFNPIYGKTFTRFFELLLVRAIGAKMVPAEKQLIYFSEEIFEHILVQESPRPRIRPTHVQIAKQLLFDHEYEVFLAHYEQGLGIARIAKALNIDSKKVYNTIYQIKRKLRESPEFLDNL
jgi:RNA polymerase sporulation-specific sigma factor